MSSVKQYWEKYREQKKSPAAPEILEGIINNCQNDRISELQGQINILEDRLVNLSRQFKMQQKDESYEILNTVGKIDKLDKIIQLKQMFDEKTVSLEHLIEEFSKSGWESKVEDWIAKSEKRIKDHLDLKLELFEQRFKKLEERFKKTQTLQESIEKTDERLTKIEDSLKKRPKFKEYVDQKLEEYSQKSIRASRSRSADRLKRQLEEVSAVQNKIKKIVIDTAEKVKKGKPTKDSQRDSKVSKSVDKITDLLKKYSKAQDTLFMNFKTLEEKTRQLEEKLESSKSFAVSEPVGVYRDCSRSSTDENFKISFGSEESYPLVTKPKLEKKNKPIF